MALGLRKRPLDFGGNPDHATLGFRVTVRWWHRHIPWMMRRVTGRLFNTNNLVASAALTEVCTLLIAVLFGYLF